MLKPQDQRDRVLLHDLVSSAQDIQEQDFNPSWVWSEPSSITAVRTSWLAFATFKEMGVVRDGMNRVAFRTALGTALERSGSEPGGVMRFEAHLLAGQAQDMIVEEGEHSSHWVNSRASTAVANLTGHLASEVLFIIGEGPHVIDRIGFADAFDTMLQNAGVEMSPGVREQMEAGRASAEVGS